MRSRSLDFDFEARLDAFASDLLVSFWLRELNAPVSIFRIADDVVFDSSASTLSFVFNDHDKGTRVLYHLESISKGFPYSYSCDLEGVITIVYPLVSLFARFTGVRPTRITSNSYSYAKKR